MTCYSAERVHRENLESESMLQTALWPADFITRVKPLPFCALRYTL